jgi:hypothetical protein
VRNIKVYRTTFTEDAIVDGEYGDAETDEETIDCEPFDEDETAVGNAAKYLMGEALTMPSTHPGFHRGVRYSYDDGSYITDYGTGERCEETADLEGFSEDEQRAIWQLVTGA